MASNTENASAERKDWSPSAIELANGILRVGGPRDESRIDDTSDEDRKAVWSRINLRSFTHRIAGGAAFAAALAVSREPIPDAGGQDDPVGAIAEVAAIIHCFGIGYFGSIRLWKSVLPEAGFYGEPSTLCGPPLEIYIEIYQAAYVYGQHSFLSLVYSFLDHYRIMSAGSKEMLARFNLAVNALACVRTLGNARPVRKRL